MTDFNAKVYDIGIRSFLMPIASLLNDESVSEIMILGHDTIYAERRGQVEKTDCQFSSVQSLEAAVNTIAQFCGKTISAAEPIMDGRLPDGSRVCVVMPPVCDGVISVNIRRFIRKAVTPDFLLKTGSATEMAVEFLKLAVESKQNIIVSGGTGSGKTTLLNILSTWFAPRERIVVIEDTRELQIQQQHVVSMEARAPDVMGEGGVSVRDMFIASLRMRPDRIIVGECRGAEAVDMLQAMNSGHSGTLTTVHADTPVQACGRLEAMASMAELGLPIDALRQQIGLAVNYIVQAARLYDGSRRVTEISEIGFDIAKGSYIVNQVFSLKQKKDGLTLEWTGFKPRVKDLLDLFGLRDQVKLTKAMFA